MRRHLAVLVGWLAGDPVLRFAAPRDDRARELERLERRYEMGQHAGGDPQAGWLRRRIAELRAQLSTSSNTEGDR